ncbi:hypothetical protein Q3G72_034592 [Acer saccharum]|nr:hypothetical protein Q3G72_034592 [Acer saccharum]
MSAPPSLNMDSLLHLVISNLSAEDSNEQTTPCSWILFHLSTDRLSILRCFSHVRCRPTSWCAIASAFSAFDLLKVLSIISLAKGIPT